MYEILIADEATKREKNKRGQKGQSSRIRRETDNDPRKMIVCGPCGQEGHTRRSSRCPGYMVIS